MLLRIIVFHRRLAGSDFKIGLRVLAEGNAAIRGALPDTGIVEM